MHVDASSHGIHIGDELFVPGFWVIPGSDYLGFLVRVMIRSDGNGVEARESEKSDSDAVKKSVAVKTK